MSAHFEMTVAVLPSDIDEQKHVNNTVYLRWIQDVATAHWRAVATPDAQKTIGWVVLRHEIDYKNPAALEDKIILRTWSAKPLGLRSNGSPKSGAIATASSYQRLVRCGAQSMRIPAGRHACQRRCAHSFRLELAKAFGVGR